ncbi:MAG: RNA polymerase sigma factor, partial [Planctomycetota bacterium]
MPSSEEQLLVKKIQDGDEQAWIALILRFEGRLTNYALKKIKDHSSCQDLVQETFLGFLSNIGNFDPSRYIQSYLFGILGNKINDLLRSRDKSKIIDHAVDSSGNQLDADHADSAIGASTWYRGDEKKKLENDALIKCLGLLINQFVQRNDYLKLKSIELIFVNGLSNLEAANILGIDNKIVASHRHYANNFIIEHLKKLNLSPDVFP